MPFTLRDIPATMRLRKMETGAALMDRWFKGKAWTMSPHEKNGDTPITAITGDKIDDTTIKMKWVLQFGRIAAVHFHLLNSWSSPTRLAASQPRLAQLLQLWTKTNGIAAGAPFRFGDLGQPVRIIETTCQINFDVTTLGVFDALDDFFAAIGRCSLKLAVSGMAQPTAGGYTLTIDEVGTYLRDTYDFIGDQELGYWSRYGVEKFLFPPIKIPLDPAKADNDGGWDRGTFYEVNNGSFRAYRTEFGQGADFFIHSDVKRATLAQPVVVEVKI